MPFESKVESAGEAGRAGADDDHLLAGWGFGNHRRLLVVHPFVVGRDPLEDHDADRLIDQSAATGLFTGMGTDAAADRRDRHVAPDGTEGIVKTVIFDLFDISGDVDMGGAAIHAGGG